MHGGFAAVLIVHERLLAPVLDAAHAEGVLSRTFAGSGEGSGVEAEWDLYLDTPVMTLLPVADGHGLRTVLRAWGPFRLTFAGQVEERDALLEVTFTTALVPSIDDEERLEVRTDADSLEVEAMTLNPLVGQWNPPFGAIVTSANFVNAVANALRAEVADSPPILPPFGLGFVAPIFDGTPKAVTRIPLDGVLAVGVDVTHEALTTAGVAADVANFIGQDDIALLTHPGVTIAQFPTAIDDVRSDVEAGGGTLDDLSMTLADGHIRVVGEATQGDGSASFSLNLVPTLCRRETIEYWPPRDWQRVTPVLKTVCRPELWFDAEDVDVDLEVPWVVDLLHGLAFLFPIGFIFNGLLAGIVNVMRELVVDQLSTGRSAGVDRHLVFTLPDAERPVIRLAVERWTLDTGGSLLGMRASVSGGMANPGILGPEVVPIDEVAETSLSFRVALPYGVSPEDHQLRVAWTLRRTDLNEVLLTSGGIAAAHLDFDVGVLPPELAGVAGLSVAVRVFRTLGAQIEEVLASLHHVTIYDRLDKSHPYVRWEHPVHKPVVHLEADGSRTHTGRSVVQRRSHIHRTDYPGRCKFAARYSRKVEATNAERRAWGEAADPRRFPAKLEYLDELPFPLDELAENRGELCDYCFFDGPGKTTPIISTG